MKSETRSYYEMAIQQAVAWIVEHLDEALDLTAIARAAALSPFHFHRIFRGMVGETPLELQRRLRMERAASSLLHTARQVTRIAFDAGYETHESFTRAFRALYGIAPSAFRQESPRAGDHCGRPFQTELAARCGIHFSPGESHAQLTPLPTGDVSMNVSIKEMPELRLGTVRHMGPYHRISEAFERLGAIAGPAGLTRQSEGAMIAVYHDDPETTREDELRSDAALTVPPSLAMPDGLAELHLPAGKYACTLHVGPYTALGDAWARLMGEWLPKSGYRVGDGMSFEIYHNTPADVAPNELRTELYVPLA